MILELLYQYLISVCLECVSVKGTPTFIHVSLRRKYPAEDNKIHSCTYLAIQKQIAQSGIEFFTDHQTTNNPFWMRVKRATIPIHK